MVLQEAEYAVEIGREVAVPLRVEVDVQCVSERQQPKHYANVLAIGLSKAAR